MSTTIESAEPRSAKSSRVLENPPNARRTMEALRELGYDSYSSILDILDNCIDAHAAKIDIEIGEQKGDIVITIHDDGTGMDEETLSEALRLGSDTEREAGDLGKFGMGLVTASIGLSQSVEVLTKEVDGPALCGGFDLEQIAAENRFVKWIGPATKEHAASFPRPKGTRVRLSKTDRISNRNATTFANTLRPRVGQVFRKFLKSGVTITVNGKPVDPIDPLMLSDPKTRLVLDTEIAVDGKGSAILRVVDLPDFGAAGNKAAGIQGRARANVDKGQIDHSTAEANITRRAPLIPKPKALIERRTPRGQKGTHPSGDGHKVRTPHITNLKTVSGLKVAFNEGDYGEQSPFYLVKPEGRTITVTYNREHPFWREFLEHASDPKVVAILDYLVFAMANSELLVPEQASVVKANVNATLVGLLV